MDKIENQNKYQIFPKKLLTNHTKYVRILFGQKFDYADVAELADALDSGSSGSSTVWVQVPSSAPSLNSLNFFTVGKRFGLFCFIE